MTTPAPRSIASRASAFLDQLRTQAADYHLTRFLLLRLLGFVYFFAFLAAANQLVPLIGHRGLLPADLYLHGAADKFGSSFAGFRQIPSVFWISVSDSSLQIVSWI